LESIAKRLGKSPGNKMPSNTIHKVKALLTEHHINLSRRRTLLAVSGGMDSVVMVEVFHQLGFQFGIAHCNFQLRGEESEGDEALVKNLAHKYKAPFFHTRFDTKAYTENKNVSIQVAARTLRYEWFEQLRSENKYDYIATAHHLNDNIETVLHNFIKGTGIKGLRGMLVRRDKLIRPMLSLSQDEIREFQETHKLDYREDSSNASDKYTRNNIRHNLVPLIEEINPGFEAGFADRLKVFSDLEMLYQDKLLKTEKQLFEKRGGDIYIPIRKLKKLSDKRSILFEYLQPQGFTISQVDDILAALDSESGRQFLSENTRVIKDRAFLIVTQKGQTDFTAVLIQKDDKEVVLANATLNISQDEAAKFKIKKEKTYAYLDLEKLEFPLMLRLWKKGDYFYPFGMAHKKKKVGKYFKDQKIPINEKEKIWILESGRKIAWIVGERIDERFRVTDGTKQVLVLHYKK
jgi:tRNA(Ile)-lysidine synthase